MDISEIQFQTYLKIYLFMKKIFIAETLRRLERFLKESHENLKKKFHENMR